MGSEMCIRDRCQEVDDAKKEMKKLNKIHRFILLIALYSVRNLRSNNVVHSRVCLEKVYLHLSDRSSQVLFKFAARDTIIAERSKNYFSNLHIAA